MAMQAMSFAEGEEKLSAAWDQINLLWQAFFALKASADIDSVAICALLASGGSAERAIEIWEQESHAWMAARLAEMRGQPEFELAVRKLKEREDFWGRQIESLPWPDTSRSH